MRNDTFTNCTFWLSGTSIVQASSQTLTVQGCTLSSNVSTTLQIQSGATPDSFAFNNNTVYSTADRAFDEQDANNISDCLITNNIFMAEGSYGGTHGEGTVTRYAGSTAVLDSNYYWNPSGVCFESMKNIGGVYLGILSGVNCDFSNLHTLVPGWEGAAAQDGTQASAPIATRAAKLDASPLASSRAIASTFRNGHAGAHNKSWNVGYDVLDSSHFGTFNGHSSLGSEGITTTIPDGQKFTLDVVPALDTAAGMTVTFIASGFSYAFPAMKAGQHYYMTTPPITQDDTWQVLPM